MRTGPLYRGPCVASDRAGTCELSHTPVARRAPKFALEPRQLALESQRLKWGLLWRR